LEVVPEVKYSSSGSSTPSGAAAASTVEGFEGEADAVVGGVERHHGLHHVGEIVHRERGPRQTRELAELVDDALEAVDFFEHCAGALGEEPLEALVEGPPAAGGQQGLE
jgi:hypothetical protein